MKIENSKTSSHQPPVNYSKFPPMSSPLPADLEQVQAQIDHRRKHAAQAQRYQEWMRPLGLRTIHNIMEYKTIKEKSKSK
jgi:hypothetical protein